MAITVHPCSSCDYYELTEPLTGRGVCRWNPPEVIGGRAYDWPEVDADHWCSRHPLIVAQSPTYRVSGAGGGGTMTGAEILTALAPVDGAGSGLDADTLDGTQLSALATDAELTAATTGAAILLALLGVDGAGSLLDADTVDGQHAAAFLLASSYTAADVLAKLLTVDGAGTGLDADTVDGQQAADLIQTAAEVTVTPASGVAATDVQGALEELSLEIAGVSGGSGLTLPQVLGKVWFYA